MKRFVLSMLLIVGLVAIAGLAKMALADTSDTETSTVTVTVPEYIAIEGLEAISFSLTFAGAPALGSGSGSDGFTVETNVAASISVSITSGTDVGPYLTATVDPTSGGPNTVSVTLDVSAADVPLTIAPNSYVETATVTATGPV
jgi:hypothetical protein